MATFAAALAVSWVRLRDWQLRPHPLLLASGAFALALLVTMPLAFYYSGPSIALQSVVRWALLCLSFFAMAWAAWGPGAQRDISGILLSLLLAAAAISAGFAVLDFFFQFQPTVRSSEQYIYLPSGPQRRAQGVFYDASALGNFCAMMLVLVAAVGRDARARLRIPRLLLWLPVAPLALALLLSFSRGAIINLAVALAVLAWLRRDALLTARALMAGTIIAVLAALSIGIFAADIAAMYALRLEYTALQFFENPNEVLSMRLDSWQVLWQVLIDHPVHLLFGIGYKTVPYTGYLPQPIVADNMYLSMLVEAGIPGLAALLLLCAAVLHAAARLERHADPAVVAMGSFLFAFWCGEMVQMISGDMLTFWRVTPAYFAVLGVALNRSSKPS